MNKLFFIILLLVIACNFLHTQEDGFGVGVIIGEPSGIGMKMWISKNLAIDAGIAWSFWSSSDPNAQYIDFENSKFQFHTDFLFHFFDAGKSLEGQLIVYTGIGGRIRITDIFFGVGARLPIGILYIIPGAPFDIFCEIVPVLGLYPATVFTGNSGIGIRWFF